MEARSSHSSDRPCAPGPRSAGSPASASGPPQDRLAAARQSRRSRANGPGRGASARGGGLPPARRHAHPAGRSVGPAPGHPRAPGRGPSRAPPASACRRVRRKGDISFTDTRAGFIRCGSGGPCTRSRLKPRMASVSAPRLRALPSRTVCGGILPEEMNDPDSHPAPIRLIRRYTPLYDLPRLRGDCAPAPRTDSRSSAGGAVPAKPTTANRICLRGHGSASPRIPRCLRILM